MVIKAVIFDLDGTLIDSNEAHAIAWANAYKLVGYGNVSIDEIRKYIGARGDVITEMVLGREAVKNYKTIRFFKDKIFLNLLRNNAVTVFPEVYDTIQGLKSYGIKLSIATSTSIPLLLIMLEYFNIIGYFDVLVAGEEVTRSKPYPDLYLEALKRTKIPPHEALIVGDTEYDIKPAKSVGAISVYVKRSRDNTTLNNVEPTYVIRDLTELFDIITRN
ncbi:MAG: HAD family hydrolase [Sulfolobales archaeon]|nr:HAD family hydrolase [Sulfolobales archaeon]MDW7969184.1 HAD family hydrolase [Sulfolobales archaeon]